MFTSCLSEKKLLKKQDDVEVFRDALFKKSNDTIGNLKWLAENRQQPINAFSAVI